MKKSQLMLKIQNGIEVFENPIFGQIRMAMVDDEPMFCLIDVCRALEINNSSLLTYPPVLRIVGRTSDVTHFRNFFAFGLSLRTITAYKPLSVMKFDSPARPPRFNLVSSSSSSLFLRL